MSRMKIIIFLWISFQEVNGHSSSNPLSKKNSPNKKKTKANKNVIKLFFIGAKAFFPAYALAFSVFIMFFHFHGKYSR